MFMGGAHDKFMTLVQAAYAVWSVRNRRTHELASNKDNHLRVGAVTFAHAGKPDLRGQALI